MSEKCCNRMFRGEAWACFFLRMWIGMRLLFAGLTKWKAKNEEGQWEFNSENLVEKNPYIFYGKFFGTFSLKMLVQMLHTF